MTREIPGISGWQLVGKLVLELPEPTLAKLKKCESPIEELFASAIAIVLQTIDPDVRPTIETQVSIAPYRADIVLVGKYGAPRIVVECDGAEFHKDIRRDTKRTAAIEQQGYRVVRRSGSQIHHNPLAHAKMLLREVGLVQ